MVDHRRGSGGGRRRRKRGERKRGEEEESSTSEREESDVDNNNNDDNNSNSTGPSLVTTCVTSLRSVTASITSVSEAALKQLEAEIDLCSGRVRDEREARILRMQTQAEDARRQEKESRLCVVCCEKEKSELLLPCKHLCVCEDCAQDRRLKQCPLCRMEIEETVSIFL